MKLSTKGRYGLRAMIDLAANSKGDYLPLHTIADRQGISERYLEQVFSALKKAGLVKSIKGAQGGYALSKDAAEITVKDVLSTLEGDISVIENVEYDKNNLLRHCIKINVWDKMNEAIDGVVSVMTLEDLVRRYREIHGEVDIMYYI
ncbi:RrF2 family transcriptional regulator [Clostridium cylindrosporum]|uniref:HTH-type transcriptional regulator IscR n=1 Tax=Clostridium cylindrosporum DSM 605 TaxID=1121307 RepID=A0A0J8FZ71_CLOCY|nr:Rrf2 family transcriptional regulator [Clostridium cylindrosporum]KMT20916.1 HTH-type transcriptional regulator IscR [Clostridium cylindrosporum DSM 605]